MGTGNRIRKLRKAAGFTQKQLAQAIGLTESAIRNYELDIRKPGADQLDAMADALGVHVASLEDIGIESARQTMEVLFRLEDTMGFFPEEADDEMAVGIDRRADGAPKMQMALKAWKAMRDNLSAGKITQDEYDAWKASFSV